MRGFSLVIALVLMAFVTLLMVTLATLTQMETQLSTQSQKSLKAQQNALLALDMALAELQKYAGPDQRTTARADLDVNLADSTTANSHWIDVYGNGAPVDYSEKPTSVANTLVAGSDSKGSQAKLLNWLVSGNENTSFDPIAGVDNDGHILSAPGSFSFTPQSSVDLTQVSSNPAQGDTQVLLVGESTSGTSSDYVAAPLVTVESGSSANTSGRYAWWIGDEGAKANVSMAMAESDQLEEAFVTAQRTAPELMDARAGNQAFDLNQLVGSNYDPSMDAIERLDSAQDLSFLAVNSQNAMAVAAKNRFHDLTSHSSSLLVDSYAGGLKKDLSALLATGTNSPADSDYLFEPEGNQGSDSFGVPTWGALRSFAQTTADSAGLEPRLPTTTDVGVGPVLTYFSLGLQYAAPEGAYEDAPIRLAMFPLVVLWNPYTVPIKAHTYEVGFTRYRYYPWMQLQVQDDDGNWIEKEAVNFNRGAGWNSTWPRDSYVRFLIDSPEIPPGASLIFTLQASEVGAFYDAPVDDEANNTLTNGLNPYGHVLVNFGDQTATFSLDDFEKDDEGNLVQKRFRVSGAHMVGDIGTYNSFGM
ncbi:MAG: pilus assembly PilX N-terminal domain-containing protein, partial [Puniceicoccales bacterium]